MRTKLAVCIAAIILCYTAAYGVTLTFYEFPSGTVLFDSSYPRVSFSQEFRATNHAGFSWGLPHSGSNVLTLVLNPNGNTSSIVFGYVKSWGLDLDPIQTVGAYFSTDIGVMVRVTAYHWTSTSPEEITSVVIGDSGQPWDNQYVEIDSPNGLINYLKFEGVNSPDDLLGFCADDMTVEPVPEPSSLAALAFGLLPIGVAAIRRRRK